MRRSLPKVGRAQLRSSRAYRASQLARKRIEQFFRPRKTVGGLRKTRLHGVEPNRGKRRERATT